MIARYKISQANIYIDIFVISSFRLIQPARFFSCNRDVGDNHMSGKPGVAGSIPGFSIKPLSVKPLGVPVIR